MPDLLKDSEEVVQEIVKQLNSIAEAGGKNEQLLSGVTNLSFRNHMGNVANEMLSILIAYQNALSSNGETIKQVSDNFSGLDTKMSQSMKGAG